MLPTLKSTSPPSRTRVPSAETGSHEISHDASPMCASDTTASPPPPSSDTPPSGTHAQPPKRQAEVWGIDFSPPKTNRKTTKKERDALAEAQLRRLARYDGGAERVDGGETTAATTSAPMRADGAVDSEGNAVVVAPGTTAAPLRMVRLDGLADHDALIPRNLTVTRADLEARLVLRLPRLLCVNKQYPRSCGVSSLTSVYNYLYSRIGESEIGQSRAPVSQEEVMSILGFEPPFGDIRWGPFTGNATLIRWFHALNAHFGLQGKASILYKEHGKGKTTHLYNSPNEALLAVKAALRDPHCAVIYHCHNHYMVPVGYQDIPLAQTDFFNVDVPGENCETTIFIGEVSRGRHEAMYARRWAEIVQDIQCASPYFFNIRHPELGLQRKGPRDGGDGGDADNNNNDGATQPKANRQTARTATNEKGLNSENGIDRSSAIAGADQREDDDNADSEVGGHPTAPAPAPKEATDNSSHVTAEGTHAKKKTQSGRTREPNNLHCLILFRNDVAEAHPEVYTRRPFGSAEGGDGAGPAAADEVDNSTTSSSSGEDTA